MVRLRSLWSLHAHNSFRTNLFMSLTFDTKIFYLLPIFFHINFFSHQKRIHGKESTFNAKLMKIFTFFYIGVCLCVDGEKKSSNMVFYKFCCLFLALVTVRVV